MAEGIAGVLAEHQFSMFDEKGYAVCTCDETIIGTGEGWEEYAAHQAGVLAANGYGKLEAVQLAARDRPESMEAARAKARADRRAAQAEAIRAAQAIAWAKGATAAGANLTVWQATG